MKGQLANPGDAVEGSGFLLQHGRLVTRVHYHLSIPTQTHFLVNSPGRVSADYADFAGGFVLVPASEAATLPLGEYTLELIDKSRRQVNVERRYKPVKHQGHPHVSFWVTLLRPDASQH